MHWKFLDSINFIARCRKYNLGLWQCPNFLFLLMGIVTVVAMVTTYLVSNIYYDESVTIISVSAVTVLIITIGHFVVSGVEQIAIANAIKTEFISILTHQLGSPLSSMKWNLEVLEGEIEKLGGLGGRNAVFLDNVKSSNEKMLKLVSYLTEVVRIDQGAAMFESEKTDLADIAKEMVHDLEKLALEKNIKITLKVGENLPKVLADPKRMRVVFDNLIGNAIKYSNEGGKVEVVLEGKNGKVITSIKDWGVGIPKYQHSRIFEKFFRSNNVSKYRTEGIGVGLYLVRSILKHFGGEVWFESLEGKGSTFYVSLPAAK